MPSFFWFIFWRSLFAVSVAIVIVLGFLDLQIRERFESNIHAQPARVYARPMVVKTGDVIAIEQIITALKQRGYVAAPGINSPGSYAHHQQLLDFHLTPQGYYQNDASIRAVRLRFSGNQIKEIIDHETGLQNDQIKLDPLPIGSLQLGSYQDRIALKLHEMPELLVRALLVMEDRNFESHIGIDLKAILRALWYNIREGRAIQGGSTLTQQLVKNLFLTPKRTLSRKAMEALMAIMMEIRYSKAEILTLYVNEIFLGQSGNRAVHGFALAAEFYFGRPLSQLKLHETATLVGMIPAPSFYNPRRHPERALKRRDLVLKHLAQFNAISDITAETLSNKPLGVIEQPQQKSSRYPAYIDYLHRQLRQFYSEEVLRTDGLKLYSTLDTNIQETAQSALDATLHTLEKQTGKKPNTFQGAVTVIDIPTGDILALVGDRVRGFSGFNRAVDAQRPIGSLVKPVVYLTALEQPHNYSLATLLADEPLVIQPEYGEPWEPQNYDKQYRGYVLAIDALVHSYNVPTVRLGQMVGIDNVVDTLKRLGIDRDVPAFPSTFLGANGHSPLEMAQLYQTLSNQGVRVPLRSILSISSSRDNVMARFPLSEQRILEKETAYLIDFALRQVVARGTAARLNRLFSPGLGLAGKTGTTDNYRDSWFAGYSGNLLTVVWVGRDDNKPTGLTGSSGALRVWEEIMSSLRLEANSQFDFSEIVMSSVDKSTGLLADSGCEEQLLLPFKTGFQPDDSAPCAGFKTKLKSWFSIRRADDLKQVPVEERNQ